MKTTLTIALVILAVFMVLGLVASIITLPVPVIVLQSIMTIGALKVTGEALATIWTPRLAR